jgi:hypothetical protein
VAAGAGHIKVVSNPLHIEAFACWKALLFAADHGMMSLEVETVCVLLQQASVFIVNLIQSCKGKICFKSL